MVIPSLGFNVATGRTFGIKEDTLIMPGGVGCAFVIGNFVVITYLFVAGVATDDDDDGDAFTCDCEHSCT